MFTGLVELTTTLGGVQTIACGCRFTIDLGHLSQDIRPGDSICVNGACLTVSRLNGKQAEFDVMAETLRVTTLSNLQPGAKVNLERAIRADGRFGGHFVQGHVDGVGRVQRFERSGSNHVLWVAASADLMKLMIPKGSVAIDGVSLTLADVTPEAFSVWLIPMTLAETNLGERRVGDAVNLEADLIAKWINHRLDALGVGTKGQAVTLQSLLEQGFTP